MEPCDAEVGYWDSDCEAWSSTIYGAEDYDGPTHWMPLPDPPQGILPPPLESEISIEDMEKIEKIFNLNNK